MLRCVQNSIKNGPASIKKHLSNQHPNLDRFRNQLGSILGGFGEPSWGQVGTKSLQKSIQKMIKKMIAFRMALRSNFNGFWLPTWHPKGESNLWFLEHFGLLGPSWGQDPPKTPPRGPKTPQELPKHPPRPLQDTPQDPSKRPLGRDFGMILASSLIVFGWFASHPTRQPAN